MSSAHWFATVDGVEQGPMTVAEMKALAAADRVGPETPIRREGMAHTVPAARVKGLLPLVTAATEILAAAPAPEPQGQVRSAGLEFQTNTVPLFAPEPPRTAPRRPAPVDMRLVDNSDNPFAAPDADLRLRPDQRDAIVVAGIGRRFLGMVIDNAVNIGIMMGLVFVMVSATEGPGVRASEGAPAVLMALICGFVALCPYWIICEGLWAATPGKLMLGMRVTDRTGAPIGFGRAIGRNLMRSVLTIIPIGGLIDAVFVLMDDGRRSLHDRVAGTYVVDLDGMPVRSRGTSNANRPSYRRS